MLFRGKVEIAENWQGGHGGGGEEAMVEVGRHCEREAVPAQGFC